MEPLEITTGAPIGSRPRASRVEFTPCGPMSKLSRAALIELLLVYVGSIGFRVLAKAWARSELGVTAAPGVLFAAAALAAAGVAAVAFLRLGRRRDYWALFLAGLLSFTSLYRFDAENLGAGTFLEVPLVLVPLVPAAIAIAAFVAMVREADEMQRRILSQSLTAGFVVTFCVTTVYTLLEDLGLPRVSAIWWLGVLTISCVVALAVYSRRYR